MKIGFDAKKVVKNRTGIGNYSRSLLRALATKHTDHRFLLYTQTEGDRRLYESLLSFSNVQLRLYWKKDKFNQELWRNKLVLNDVRDDGTSIYHGLSNELPIGIGKSGVKSVVTIHDLIFLRYPKTYGWFARKILKWKTKYACRHADAVVAISEQTKRDIVDYYHIPEEKIHVIAQGCDEIFYKKQTSEQLEKVRQKYALPSRYLLNVGTIQKRKNQELLIRAMKHVEEDVQLVLVGGNKDKYYTELLDLIKQQELEGRVIFLQGVSNEELAALYQMTEVFLYASVYEGFGIPLLEAAVSEVPVISAPGSCLPEVAGPHSLYAPYGEPEKWAEAINRLLQDKDLRESMIRDGLEYAKQFQWKVVTDKIMALYENL